MTVKEVAAVSKGLVGAPELSFSRSENYCVSIVDMVDSTRIVAEVQDPIRIRDLYSMFVDGMSTIARRFGARVIKNMGDSIVVYFPNTTDTANASSFRDVIECGLAMIGNRCNLNNLFHEAELPSIGYRISADYGRLEVGNSRSSKEHDLFGSTMNLCSKINKIALRIQWS